MGHQACAAGLGCFGGELALPAARTATFPQAQVARIGRRLAGCSYERLYGAFGHTRIAAGAARKVQQSVQLYCGLLDGSVVKAYT